MGFVVGFILRNLEKAASGINWEQLKKDVEVQVRAFVPGTWFDDEAVALVNLVLDQAKAVLENGSGIKVVLELLAAKEWNKAALALKELLLGGWVPEGYKKGPNGLYAASADAAATPAAKAFEALRAA